MSEENNEDKQTIPGTLARIIFKNDNNFVIGSFRDPTTDAPFSAIGTMINPQVKMDYSLTGKWESNAKYGDQFRFNRYETIRPKDANGIFKYIVRQCKFVGATVGNQIVDKYGDETLEVMKGDPERIATDIQGITLSRAQEIKKTLIENETDEAVLVELEGLLDVPGMRKSLLGDLISTYGNNAGDVLRGDPYILTSFNGIGFAMADRVALNIGFPRDSPARKRAATIHILKEVMMEGSIWIDRKELITRVKELIPLKNLSEGLEILLEEKTVVQNEDNLIAFRRPASDEKKVAKLLATLEVMI